MENKIKVAVLDDHQGILFGYKYILETEEDIDIVATMMYGEDLEPFLDQNEIDVLILDIQVPTSQSNPNPFPILYLLPNLLSKYPHLAALIITMHAQRSMIHAIMEAGASGYVLKEDQAAIKSLPNLIRNVAEGGIYLSKHAYHEWVKSQQGDLNQPLTQRQLEVLSLCAAYPNSSTHELAYKMGIAHSTVRNLLSKSYLKLNVNNRAAAIAEAHRLGLIPTNS